MRGIELPPCASTAEGEADESDKSTGCTAVTGAAGEGFARKPDDVDVEPAGLSLKPDWKIEGMRIRRRGLSSISASRLMLLLDLDTVDVAGPLS